MLGPLHWNVEDKINLECNGLHICNLAINIPCTLCWVCSISNMVHNLRCEGTRNGQKRKIIDMVRLYRTRIAEEERRGRKGVESIEDECESEEKDVCGIGSHDARKCFAIL